MVLKSAPHSFCTFVVVSPVVAVLLEEHVAIFAVPTVVTPALPLAVVADSALAVPGTGIRATFHGAVFPVPTGHAQAGTVLTLAVFVAPRIALLQIAQLARPSGQTVAGVVHAMPVGTAIQIAQLCENYDLYFNFPFQFYYYYYYYVFEKDVSYVCKQRKKPGGTQKQRSLCRLVFLFFFKN